MRNLLSCEKLSVKKTEAIFSNSIQVWRKTILFNLLSAASRGKHLEENQVQPGSEHLTSDSWLSRYCSVYLQRFIFKQIKCHFDPQTSSFGPGSAKTIWPQVGQFFAIFPISSFSPFSFKIALSSDPEASAFDAVQPIFHDAWKNRLEPIWKCFGNIGKNLYT